MSTSIAESIPVNTEAAAPKIITVAILAMGGEGGGVLADWIVDLAEHCGYSAQTTSVPGVAQRTGSTVYYVELFPLAAAQAAGKEPVLALMPIPGEVDIVLASELMEAGRAVEKGLVTSDRTTLITSTHRVYAMSEKTAMSDGRVDAGKFIAAGQAAAKIFVHSDFAKLAEEAGSVISAALFGALAGAGSLPFARTQFEEAIQRGGVGVESSVAAFAAGFRAATTPASAPSAAAQPKVGPRLQSLAARIENQFPATSHEILLAGILRLADFQDERYAAQYLDRLEPVREAATQFGKSDPALLRETARYLALWMSYEDAIRVADLKTRRTRFERVNRETRAGQAQLVQINEFLHPRIQEMADVLPAALGKWLLGSGWARKFIGRFTRHGKVVQTTSLSGFCLLYLLASLRPWRRASLRFREEQKNIEAWLARIPSLAQEDYALALEVAECQQLVKGYGDTHANGSRNFNAIMNAIPRLQLMKDAAAHVKRLRDAALADDTGRKLEDALREVTP